MYARPASGVRRRQIMKNVAITKIYIYGISSNFMKILNHENLELYGTLNPYLLLVKVKGCKSVQFLRYFNTLVMQHAHGMSLLIVYLLHDYTSSACQTSCAPRSEYGVWFVQVCTSTHTCKLLEQRTYSSTLLTISNMHSETKQHVSKYHNIISKINLLLLD